MNLKPSMKKTLLAQALLVITSSSYAFELLEEVVVTAQKREQNLQDVGVSVTVFTGDAMKELGMTDSINVAAQTPGLSFGSTGGLNNILNIRGVSQNDFATHQESPVTVYVDEGYISFTSAQLFTNLDLDRVEVLRGPQGTLFGRNSTGGLLHFVTRKPSLEETGGNLSIEAGEDGLIRTEAGFGGPLSDTVAARIAASYAKNDDYMDNIGTGPDVGAAEEWTVRGTLVMQPTNELAAILSLSAYEDENDSSGWGAEPAALDPATGLTIDVDGDVPGAPRTGPETFAGNHTPHFKSEATSANLKIEYDVGDVTFTSVTTFLNHEAQHIEDSDGYSDLFGLGDLGQIFIVGTQDNEQLTQEFRLDGAFDDGGTWVAGVYYLDREATGTNDINYGALLDDALLGAGAVTSDAIDYNEVYNGFSEYSQDTRSWAVFAQVEVSLTDTLALTIGGRHTDDKLDYEYAPVDFIDGVTFGDAFGPLWVAPVSEREREENGFSGKIQLDWTPSNDMLIYAGISQGLKGGGWNYPYVEGGAGAIREFENEVLTSYEVGIKSTLADGLRLNGAAYYYDYKDYQGFQLEGLSLFVVNADAESQGMELELVATPAEGLNVLLGVAYMETEIVSGTDKGNEMPFSPELSANLLIRKGWVLDNGGEFAVQLDANWSDDQEMDTLNSPGVLIEDKYTVNARISYTTADENMTFALMGKNITDEENVMFGVPVGVLGYNQVIWEKPRWISAEVTYNF